MRNFTTLNRRAVLGGLAAAGAGALAYGPPVPARSAEAITRKIPSTGEALPAVGLGSWITFNVGDDPVARKSCADVMQAFFEGGGRMIDSSPMYGSAQEVIGYGLKALDRTDQVFSADKVWISSSRRGPAQVEESRRLWNVPRFDLLQVHNLLSWEEHLDTLQAMKNENRLRYVGITTSEGRRREEFEQVMRSRPLDFIQVTYNILDREVEERILPLAQERGIGVVINRPFRQGALIDAVKKHPLPEWAAEFDAANWAQFLLKFILSHPAATCVIPATTRVDHVRENLGAAQGRLPDQSMRRKMIAHVEGL